MRKYLLCFVLIYFNYNISAVTIDSISLQNAWIIIKDSILLNDTNVNVFVSNSIVSPKSPIQTINGIEGNSPDFDSWFFFVDDMPFENWSHPCRYIFVNKANGEVLVYKKQSPPRLNDMTPLIEQRIDNIEGEKLNIRNAIRRKDRVCNALSANKFAVILSGGFNNYYNWERYWNDCSLMYKALVNVYNYNKENIFVLMSDGNNPGNDRHLLNGSFDSSPLDLDGDGFDDIQYSATKSNLTTVFNILDSIMTADDDLFVFTTDHGCQIDGTHTGINLWDYDILHDYEFAAYLNNLNVNNISVCMGQCHSGGFVDNLTNEKIIISTACRYDESSWATSNHLYDEYLYHWVSAVVGETPNGISVNADFNNDGFVTMYEAFKYAEQNDIKNEHPQYMSLPAIQGDIACLMDSAKVYIHGFSFLNNQGTFQLKGLPYDCIVLWSISNPNFSLTSSGNNCTVTYTNGNQYDTAVLTATIKRNNTVVKTLTKQITKVGWYIAGNDAVCGSAVYNIAALPDSISVSWSTDYMLGITSGQNTSVVTVNKQDNGFSTLTAAIKHNADTLIVLTKTIKVSTPALDEPVFYNYNGISTHWIEGNAGNVAVIPPITNSYYDQYECNIYRLNNQFQEVLVYHSYNSSPYFEYSNAVEGWYVVYIRGIGDCGNSAWSSGEIETLAESNHGPGEELLCNIIYEPGGNYLIVKWNDSEMRQSAESSKNVPANNYEIQIWNNMRLVKTVSSNQQETRVSLTDLPKGIYIANVIKNGKNYSKKFVRMN